MGPTCEQKSKAVSVRAARRHPLAWDVFFLINIGRSEPDGEQKSKAVSVRAARRHPAPWDVWSTSVEMPHRPMACVVKPREGAAKVARLAMSYRELREQARIIFFRG